MAKAKALTMKGGSNDALTLVAPTERRHFENILIFLRDEIVAGTLKPGDRLLPERELAKRLGVARTSLREALRAIEMLGLIETRPGQGAFVRRPSIDVLKEVFGVALFMDPVEVAGMLEARMAIECQAIRLACRYATKSDLALIRTALDDLIATADDGGLGGDADFRFHTAIVRASKNATLLVLYEALQRMLQKSHRERREAISRFPELIALLGTAHKAIYQRIVEGGEDAAEGEMRRHFSLADDYLREHDSRSALSSAGEGAISSG
jgi:DNA-binding FadR family transcriptional regulator